MAEHAQSSGDSRGRISFGALALATLLGLAAVPAHAAAAPAWIPPVTLSAAGHDASGPDVAVDAAGNTFAVWQRSDGKNTIIQAAVRKASTGIWGAPVDLSTAGQNASDPHVAVNSSGDAIAVWSRSNGLHALVQAATRPASTGVWRAPVQLSVAQQDALAAKVAVDAKGNASVVWIRQDGATGRFYVQAIVQPILTLAFTSPIDLTETDQSADAPALSVDAQGNTMFVWRRSNGTNQIVQALLHSATSGWSESHADLSLAGQSAGPPQVAYDSAGNALVIWSRPNGSATPAKVSVQAAERPAGAAWKPAIDLIAAASVGAAEIAGSGTGDVIAVWQASDGTRDRVGANIWRPSVGDWRATSDVSGSSGDARFPHVTVDAKGNAAVVWVLSTGTTSVIQASVRSANTGFLWPAALDVSVRGQRVAEPSVVLDRQGNAIAVWTRSNGTNDVTQVSTFDVTGPALTGLSVPASGTAGQSLRFSVTPSDTWSGIASTRWDFGDGKSASGAAATHTYTGAGSFKVTVTTTDAVGNATTSAARTVVVRAAPSTRPPAPPGVLPAISGLKVVPSPFQAAPSGPSRVVRKPRLYGATVSFTLNKPATVRFTFLRVTVGRRTSAGTCAAATAANQSHAPCIRRVVRGVLVVAGRTGANAFGFTGRFARRRLPAGNYELAAVAKAGSQTGKRVVVRFRVIP